jgi:hypothetical protein
MYSKQNYTWSKETNYLDTEYFINTLEKLKTYSKSMNASGYSITNTLDDVYQALNYQHAFWIMLSDTAPESIQLNGLTAKKDLYYNLTKYMTDEQILDSTELRSYIAGGVVKAANSLLFEVDGADTWFAAYPATDNSFTHILINADYTLDSWKSTFQKSEAAGGYSVQNLFTSEKVISRLLKNFHLVDVASTGGIDLVQSYPILLMDGVKLENGYRVLLKNQIDPVENGIYIYLNKKFQLEQDFNTVEDFYLLSVYVKEGLTNSGKQFFLDREDGGQFPTIEDEKIFIEGSNMIIRNRISYRLLRNHELTDAAYFTQYEPVTTTDFSNRATVSDNFYYEVSEDGKQLFHVENGETTEYTLEESEAKFHARIILDNATPYLLVNNTIVSYNPSTKTLTNIHTLSGVVLDFQKLGTDFYVLSSENGSSAIYKVESNGTYSNAVTIPHDTIEFSIMRETIASVSETLYFFTTPDSISVSYKDKVHVVEYVKNASSLRPAYSNGSVTLAYIENKTPKSLQISVDYLFNMFSWKKEAVDYKTVPYSKTQDGVWSIVDGNLYLKGMQITGEGVTTIPKISTSTERSYDGINDHSILSTQPFEHIKQNKSFTIEFKVKAKGTKVNTSLFYLGEKSKTVTNNGTTYKIPATNYMSFVVSDTDGFPYFIISTSSNKVIKVKANRLIEKDKEVNISFTYQYSSLRAVCRLYFNGELVGTAVDQKNLVTQNNPINITNINAEVFLVAKSELNEQHFYGDVSEFRLWNREMNPAQIRMRNNTSIAKVDVLYDHLKGYWKLVDVSGNHKEEILNEVGTVNVFNGGLNSDPLLKTITKAHQIQLSKSNLYILAESDTAVVSVYRLDTRDEKLYKTHTSDSVSISSIHYNEASNMLYYLKGDVFSATGEVVFNNTGAVIDDFTVVGEDALVYIRRGNNIYRNDSLMATLPANTKTIHGEISNGLINLFATNNTGVVSLYTDDYADIDTIGFKHIVDYPFDSKSTVSINTDTFTLADNRLYANGKVVDSNLYWDVNLKAICSIQKRDSKLLILVSTLQDEIQMWEYNHSTGKAVRFTGLRGATMQQAATADFTYYKIGSGYEFIATLAGNVITWYKIEKNNKLNWTSVKWEYTLNTDITYTEITSQTDQTLELWLLGEQGNERYATRVMSNNTNHDLWEHNMTYTKAHNGLIVGSTGLIFKDTLSNGASWKVELMDSLYKNKHNDIQLHIESQSRNKGYSVDAWSGLAWVAGEKGSVIRTKDAGQTWEALNTNSNFDLNSISFIDDKIGLVAGNNGVLYSTVSGGDTFTSVVLPENTKSIDWQKVLVYNSNKALLIGNAGMMLLLTRSEGTWSVGRRIEIVYNTKTSSEKYQQTLLDAVYIGNQSCIVVGERDMICHVNLETGATNIISTNQILDWKQVTYYSNPINNTTNVLVTSNTGVYEVAIDRWVSSAATNVHTIPAYLVTGSNVNKIACWGEGEMITVANRAAIERYTLYTDGLSFTASTTKATQEQHIKKVFTPKLLFLDYYLGRKINLHLEDGGYEVPMAKIAKNVLAPTYKLPNNSYLEFSNTGTVAGQYNFLAYQDYYFMNRRVLDGGSNTFGKMAAWNSYNKRITAKTVYTPYVWSAVATTSEAENGMLKDLVWNDGFSVKNTDYEKTATDTAPAENPRVTKLELKTGFSGFVVSANDVLSIDFVKTDKAIRLNEGITVHFDIKTVAFGYDVVSTVNNGKIKVTYQGYDTEINAIVNGKYLTVAELETIVLTTIKKISGDATATVSAGISILSDTVIVRDVDAANKVIVIWDLLKEDIIADVAHGAKMKLNNLNYFNGNLLHLESIMERHLIGNAYDITVNDKDNLIITGIVNDLTKYYNLESVITLKVGTATHTLNVKYSDDVVYGANYNMQSFLGNINPVFTGGYNFMLPAASFGYNHVVKNGNSEFKEFTIAGNKISVGEDNMAILDFKAGLFYDITRGVETVSRVYLSKIEVETYSEYPDKKRYNLYFDQILDQNLDSAVQTITITGRGLLSQISEDFEFTDNMMFPLPTTGVEHFNRTYFNQKKTSAAYANFILNDDNIRRYVSGVVFLDEANDWNINIIDWKKDPNMIYYPVDIHELGIDKVFKKAVSVTPHNMKMNANRLALENIDLEKYNFKLVDGLSLKELEQRYHWVLNADVRNAVIGENEKGLVWYQGDWISGIWESGIWHSGSVYDIEWISGEFYANKVVNNFNLMETTSETHPSFSVWYNGFWGSGNWHNGTWFNGTWYSGNRYQGLWLNGLWRNGTWHNGAFDGGTWLNGTWLNGTFSELSMPAIWMNGTWLGGDFENGVWKNGIFDQTVRIASRFGTKASGLHQAVWEYGHWKNGEFHSGLTMKNNVVVGSEDVKNAIWYNGIWERGTFYGGVWKFGRWNNGVWMNGFWQSAPELEKISSRHTVDYGTHTTTPLVVSFKQPHYFKQVNGLENYMVFIGKPAFVNGNIVANVEHIGHNTNFIKHKVEIIDEYSVLLHIDNLVLPQPTEGGTTSSDYTLNSYVIPTRIVSFTELGYTSASIVSHWVNGTWFGGIWENGYFSNGFWKGGIWLDGVFNNGEYGE